MSLRRLGSSKQKSFNAPTIIAGLHKLNMSFFSSFRAVLPGLDFGVSIFNHHRSSNQVTPVRQLLPFSSATGSPRFIISRRSPLRHHCCSSLLSFYQLLVVTAGWLLISHHYPLTTNHHSPHQFTVSSTHGTTKLHHPSAKPMELRLAT